MLPEDTQARPQALLWFLISQAALSEQDLARAEKIEFVKIMQRRLSTDGAPSLRDVRDRALAVLEELVTHARCRRVPDDADTVRFHCDTKLFERSHNLQTDGVSFFESERSFFEFHEEH